MKDLFGRPCMLTTLRNGASNLLTHKPQSSPEGSSLRGVCFFSYLCVCVCLRMFAYLYVCMVILHYCCDAEGRRNVGGRN